MTDQSVTSFKLANSSGELMETTHEIFGENSSPKYHPSSPKYVPNSVNISPDSPTYISNFSKSASSSPIYNPEIANTTGSKSPITIVACSDSTSKSPHNVPQAINKQKVQAVHASNNLEIKTESYHDACEEILLEVEDHELPTPNLPNRSSGQTRSSSGFPGPPSLKPLWTSSTEIENPSNHKMAVLSRATNLMAIKDLSMIKSVLTSQNSGTSSEVGDFGHSSMIKDSTARSEYSSKDGFKNKKGSFDLSFPTTKDVKANPPVNAVKPFTNPYVNYSSKFPVNDQLEPAQVDILKLYLLPFP